MRGGSKYSFNREREDIKDCNGSVFSDIKGLVLKIQTGP